MIKEAYAAGWEYGIEKVSGLGALFKTTKVPGAPAGKNASQFYAKLKGKDGFTPKPHLGKSGTSMADQLRWKRQMGL